MKSILDPSFRYVSSLDTDIRKTFARIRRELQRERNAHKARTHARPAAVLVPLRVGQGT